MSNEIIHHCDWSGQPDIHIRCSGKWTTPTWNKKRGPQLDGVYEDDEGDLYAFDETLVTCSACRVAPIMRDSK